MKDSTVLVLIIIVGFLTFSYDSILSDIKDCLEIQKNKSKRFLILMIAFGHHLFSIFGFFGWLFNNKIILSIYILSLVAMVILWKINSGKCFITMSITKLSNNDNYKKFNDIYKITGIKKLIRARYLYYGSLGICLSIALFKLIKY